jgi:DEAD/DEAH box helicase domain-containing protein
MRKIVLDLETKNSFQDVGRREPRALDISLVGIYDSADDSYKSFLENELGALWPLLEASDVIIGFNTIGFDIPILNKYYPGDLLAIKQIDIMREIEVKLGRRVGLGAVATGTLGSSKSADGLQAIRWWREGAIDKIRKYCLEDVRITKEIYDHALMHGKLTVSYNNEPFDVALDISGWEIPSEKVVAATLPF